MDESGAGHGSRPHPQPSTGADRISSLPDDLLLHVLSHLGYADAAARKTLLSRRWRGLFSHLPSVDVTLRDVPLDSLEDALRRVACPGVRLLDIAVPAVQDRPTPTAVSSARAGYWHLRFAQGAKDTQGPCGVVSSLLREAARLSPAQLRLTLPPSLTISPGDRCVAVELPRFPRATSIDLRVPPHIPLTRSRDCTGFPLLEALSLSGSRVDLDALIPRCPRLRVLTVADAAPGGVEFSVQSFSLQELAVVDRSSMPTRRIVVQAPRLRRLAMSFKASQELSMSVVAPLLEKVSWGCSYAIASVYRGLGSWRLLEVRLDTAEEHGWWSGCRNAGTAGEKDASSPPPASVNVLSLRMACSMGILAFPDEESGFAVELSKHVVADFSGLELHLLPKGHTFGSFVWRLLGMQHIRRATRSLRIVLLRSKVIVECRPNCLCDGPWSIEPVSLPNLEKLEIEGFMGEDHEFDFLKLLFRRAPMLTRVTVRLPDQGTPNGNWCAKLHDIFAAHPYVEGNIDLIPSN